MNDIKIQDLADKFTNETLTAIYGERFSSLDNVEDDEQIDFSWEFLNSKFYNAIEECTSFL